MVIPSPIKLRKHAADVRRAAATSPRRGGRGRLASAQLADRSKWGEGANATSSASWKRPLTRIPSLRFAALRIPPLPARGRGGSTLHNRDPHTTLLAFNSAI